MPEQPFLKKTCLRKPADNHARPLPHVCKNLLWGFSIDLTHLLVLAPRFFSIPDALIHRLLLLYGVFFVFIIRQYSKIGWKLTSIESSKVGNDGPLSAIKNEATYRRGEGKTPTCDHGLSTACPEARCVRVK